MDGRVVTKNDPPSFRKWVYKREWGKTGGELEVYHWASYKGTLVWRYSHNEPDDRVPEPELSDEKELIAKLQKNVDELTEYNSRLQVDCDYLSQRLLEAEDVIRNMYHNIELVPLADLIEYKQKYHLDLENPDDQA